MNYSFNNIISPIVHFFEYDIRYNILLLEDSLLLKHKHSKYLCQPKPKLIRMQLSMNNSKPYHLTKQIIYFISYCQTKTCCQTIRMPCLVHKSTKIYWNTPNTQLVCYLPTLSVFKQTLLACRKGTWCSSWDCLHIHVLNTNIYQHLHISLLL